MPTLLYGACKNNITMDTTKDLITLAAGTTRHARLWEVKVVALGTTNLAGEIGLYRCTGGSGGTGGSSPLKFQSDQPNAHVQFWTAWSVQPTLVGDPLVRLQCNANGWVDRWLAKVGEEIIFRSQEQLSLRPITGSHPVGFHILWEEL